MADPSTTNPPAAPPPGLINQPPAVTSAASTLTPGTSVPSSNLPGPQAAGYTAGTAQATGYAVPQGATVASQVDNIIAAGSPLMQQAQAKAMETMNSRGLENSSQAVTAGETGLLNAAVPIATSDAAALQAAATNTSNAENSMTQFNTGQQNSALAARATQQNSLGQTAMNNETAIQQQQLVNAGNIANINAQGVINVQLTNLTNANKLLLQSNAGAAQLYAQNLAFMSAISQDPNMNTDQKSAALNNGVQQLNDALAVMASISGTPQVQSTLNFQDPSSSSSEQTPGSPNNTPGPPVPFSGQPTVNA